MLHLITFFYIFGWIFAGIVDLVLIISFLMFFWVFVINRGRINKIALEPFTLFILLATYSLLVTIASGGLDIALVTRIIRIIVTFLGGVSIAYEYKKKYGHLFWNKIVIGVYLAISIHAVFIIIMYLNGGIRELVYSITNAYSYVNLNTPFLSGYRITGLTYGLSQTSVIQLFPALMFFKIWQLFGKNFWGQTFIVITQIASIISILLTGRTGLLLFFLLIPVVFILEIKRIPRKEAKKILVCFTTVGLVFALLLLLGLGDTLVPAKLQSYNLRQAREVFEVFSTGDSPTINVLREMYFLPEDTRVLIFGSSYLGRSDLLYIRSDVGYVRLIFALGFLGLLIYLAPYLLMLYRTIRFRRLDRSFSNFYFFVLLASLILNFKELALYTRGQWSIQAILFAAIMLSYQSKDSFKDNFYLRGREK